MTATSRQLRGIESFTDAAGKTRYRVRIRRGGHTINGEWVAGQQFNASFDKLADAIAYRDAALGASRGLNPPPELPAPAAPEPPGRAISVVDAARRLCRGMRDHSIRTRDGSEFKPGTVRNYEEALRVLVIPEIGSVPITTLTTGDVQRLVDGIAARRTPEHSRKALTALRVSLRVAIRYEEIPLNPCSGVRVPTSAEGEKPPTILTPEQVDAIIAEAEKDDARLKRSFAAPLIALAAGTGLRAGELLALPWGPDGLDLDGAVVRVRRSVGHDLDESKGLTFMAPKSRASRRDAPLPPEEVARLRRHRLATGRPADGMLVFADSNGGPLSQLPGRRAFQRASKAAGITPVPRFHDLRHAYASFMLASGTSAHATARLLGHSDAGLVWRRYGHALPDELASAGEVLSAWRASRSG